MQLCKPKLCCHAFLDRRSFFSDKPSKHTILVHIFLIVLSWIWSFNKLVSLLSLQFRFWVVCHFSERYTVWSWGEFDGMSTPERIHVCFECLPLVNKLPHCRMMDFTLFENGLVTLPKLMAATIASLKSLLVSYLFGIVLAHTWRLQTRKLPKHLLL